MNNKKIVDFSLTDVEQIKKIRRRLTEFDPKAGYLEVVFQLPNGESVRIPISRKSKINLVSKEVRNYLAEEQLIRQERDHQIRNIRIGYYGW